MLDFFKRHININYIVSLNIMKENLLQNLKSELFICYKSKFYFSIKILFLIKFIKR